MNLSNTEQNRLSAFGNTMLRGCTLEYFILECLLDLSNRKHYLQYSNIINTFVEERLKDLLRDFGEVRTTYNREFNERTSLICWNQNPSLPALVLDSVSDLSYSFYEELMNEPSGSRLSMEIGKAGIMLKQWKNVNPHFKLVSNIAGLIHQNNEDGSRSQGKIVFLLDRQKLLYESNLQIDFLHAQMKISAQLGLDDYPLIDRVDNHLVSPNLETLVFLCYALELDRVNLTFIAPR